MLKWTIGLTLSVSLLTAQTPRPVAAPKPSFSQPAVSPDGKEVAFVSAGDIWVVPAAGGQARLLVAHPAADERPLYSPDGTRLAFLSDRSGFSDIWILTFATGRIARLTFEGVNQLDAWSEEGEWIYFNGGGDIYRVRSTGGTPMPVAADRDGPEIMASPSPDGRHLTIVARSNNQFTWWRRGRAYGDESELWRVNIENASAPRYELLLKGGAKQQWPVQFPGSQSVFFVSDRSGEQNLWELPAKGEPRMLTSFTNGRVVWPTIARTGQIAFERDFGIWLYEPKARTTREVPITLAAGVFVDATEHHSLSANFSDLAVSPDGKKIAFSARGEVFAASAADGGQALRVTRTPAVETELRWSPDSRKLAYTANRTGVWQIYLYDFPAKQEVALTEGPGNANVPRFSPDGKSLAFVRNASELCVLNVDTREIRVLARGFFGRPPMMLDEPIAWSPDNRWIAFLSAGAKHLLNAWIVPAAGGEPRQITWLANAFAWPYSGGLSWSGDGRFLLWNTGARTESAELYRIDLLARKPSFREEQFTNLFDTPPKPAPAGETRVDFEGIRHRLSSVPIGLDVNDHVLALDGKTAIFTARVAGQQNIFSYSLDELVATPAVAKQITSTAAPKTSLQIATDGKTIWFLEGGRPVKATLDPQSAKPLAVRADLDSSFEQDKWEVFHQAWEYLNENFYDSNFHGVDWNGVRQAYAPRIAGARTPGELRRALNLMVGEMNASHMGVFGPFTGEQGAAGRLGLDWDREAYEARGEFRVAAVVPMGPASIAGLRPGEVIVELDGTPLAKDSNLPNLLARMAGRKVTLTVVNGGGRRAVDLRPILAFEEDALRYKNWVNERRAIVDRLSGGRLGYVHIPNMGPTAPADLQLALDSENQQKAGIVVDIRNNGGGFTNGHVLDMFVRRPYVDMAQRGAPPVSSRLILGQRAVQVPTILVVNRRTVSDGENFTEGYRAMGLGKVVGEPTAGADVFTGVGNLVDGTRIRLPYMRNAQLDQTPLERSPRPVDLPSTRPVGEGYSGRDTQIEAAVRHLLAQIAN